MNIFDPKEETPIFQTGINESSRAYLLEAARWAKFISITGFILFAIYFLAVIAMIIGNGSDISRQFGALYGTAFSAGMIVAFVIGGGIFFYINLKMFQFARNTKNGLHSLNQIEISNGFKHLKNMFKSWGIVTILLLALYGLIIVFALIGVAMAS